MEKRIFAVLLMAVFVLQAMSQNLKGKVVDNKGIPIAFANVLPVAFPFPSANDVWSAFILMSPPISKVSKSVVYVVTLIFVVEPPLPVA